METPGQEKDGVKNEEAERNDGGPQARCPLYKVMT